MIYAQLEDLREAMRFSKGKFFIVMGKDGFSLFENDKYGILATNIISADNFFKDGKITLKVNHCRAKKPYLKRVSCEYPNKMAFKMG